MNRMVKKHLNMVKTLSYWLQKNKIKVADTELIQTVCEYALSE